MCVSPKVFWNTVLSKADIWKSKFTQNMFSFPPLPKKKRIGNNNWMSSIIHAVLQKFDSKIIRVYLTVCTYYMCMHAKSLPSHLTLCNHIDHSPLGSSIPEDSPGKHCCALLQGIFMTQGSNWCLMSLALAGRFLTTSTMWEAHTYYIRYTYMYTYSIYL